MERASVLAIIFPERRLTLHRFRVAPANCNICRHCNGCDDRGDYNVPWVQDKVSGREKSHAQRMETTNRNPMFTSSFIDGGAGNGNDDQEGGNELVKDDLHRIGKRFTR